MKTWREAYLRGEPWARAAWKVWSTAPIWLVLCGCSAEYMREKPIVTDLHKYCLEFPRDAACNEHERK